MALEQITGEVVTDDQDQDKDQPAPKSKLAAMKKKVKTMDTELRSNVPVSQVKKEDQDFVDAMEDARKKTAIEIAKKKIGIMQNISPAARRSAIMNRNMDARDKKGILEKVYDKVTGQDN